MAVDGAPSVAPNVGEQTSYTRHGLASTVRRDRAGRRANEVLHVLASRSSVPTPSFHTATVCPQTHKYLHGRCTPPAKSERGQGLEGRAAKRTCAIMKGQGSGRGHVVPGLFFLLAGLHWYAVSSRRRTRAIRTPRERSCSPELARRAVGFSKRSLRCWVRSSRAGPSPSSPPSCARWALPTRPALPRRCWGPWHTLTRPRVCAKGTAVAVSIAERPSARAPGIRACSGSTSRSRSKSAWVR
eukprot:scaffold549_cov385-Prasinococcus_capsulatus_cf.AAC.28